VNLSEQGRELPRSGGGKISGSVDLLEGWGGTPGAKIQNLGPSEARDRPRHQSHHKNKSYNRELVMALSRSGAQKGDCPLDFRIPRAGSFFIED